MKALNENQKDIIGTVFAMSLFTLVIGYLTINQAKYTENNKAPQIEAKHVQSPVLEKYGELITKNK